VVLLPHLPHLLLLLLDQRYQEPSPGHRTRMHGRTRGGSSGDEDQ
jgi:hypothetical protein